MSGNGRAIRFGVFEVDLHTGELRKQGLKIKLRDQPFQILLLLLAHPGEVVSRDELQKQTLAGRHVCRFRSRSEQGSQSPPRRLGRLGGKPPLHRNVTQARLSVHRASQRRPPQRPPARTNPGGTAGTRRTARAWGARPTTWRAWGNPRLKAEAFGWAAVDDRRSFVGSCGNLGGAAMARHTAAGPAHDALQR